MGALTGVQEGDSKGRIWGEKLVGVGQCGRLNAGVRGGWEGKAKRGGSLVVPAPFLLVAPFVERKRWGEVFYFGAC